MRSCPSLMILGGLSRLYLLDVLDLRTSSALRILRTDVSRCSPARRLGYTHAYISPWGVHPYYIYLFSLLYKGWNLLTLLKNLIA